MERGRLEQARRVYRGVHHEMSNPIGGAMGCIEVLRAGCVEEHEVETYLVAIRDGLSRVNRLATAYRVYLSDAGVRSGPVPIANVVEQARLLIDKEAKVKGIGLRIDPTDAVASGTPAVCLRALVSLGLHVIDDARPRCEMRIMIAEHAGDEVVITMQAEGESTTPSAVLVDDDIRIRELGGRLDVGSGRIHLPVWDG